MFAKPWPMGCGESASRSEVSRENKEKRQPIRESCCLGPRLPALREPRTAAGSSQVSAGCVLARTRSRPWRPGVPRSTGAMNIRAIMLTARTGNFAAAELVAPLVV